MRKTNDILKQVYSGLGITNASLSRCHGVEEATFSRWLSGTSQPSENVLLAAAKTLNDLAAECKKRAEIAVNEYEMLLHKKRAEAERIKGGENADNMEGQNRATQKTKA